jgi:hypothetical protein
MRVLAMRSQALKKQGAIRFSPQVYSGIHRGQKSERNAVVSGIGK